MHSFYSKNSRRGEEGRAQNEAWRSSSFLFYFFMLSVALSLTLEVEENNNLMPHTCSASLANNSRSSLCHKLCSLLVIKINEIPTINVTWKVAFNCIFREQTNKGERGINSSASRIILTIHINLNFSSLLLCTMTTFSFHLIEIGNNLLEDFSRLISTNWNEFHFLNAIKITRNELH